MPFYLTEQVVSDSVQSYYGLELDELVYSTHNKRAHGAYHSGGAFAKMSSWNRFKPGRVDVDVNWFGTIYPFHDPIVPDSVPVNPLKISDLPTTPSWESMHSTLATYGPTAVRRARPGKEIGGAFQFLVELRDLPRRPGRALLRAGVPGAIRDAQKFVATMAALGSEYLNVAFGWKPFVSDLQSLYETHTRLDKELDNLRRNHGKAQRRRRTIVNSRVTNDTYTQTTGLGYWSGVHRAPNNSPFTPSGVHSVFTQTVVENHIWFAGRFRTYVPYMGTSEWTGAATRALYGLNVTPEHLYQVIPWSWLVDWFTNVGAVISNLSSNAAGNLFMDYGFLMQRRKETTSVSQDYTCSALNIATSVTHEYGWESKTRIMASPFGFGLKYDDLTGYQKSILAALGLSRANLK